MARKVGIVTGAASGIGRAAAIRLSSQGISLAIFDVNHDGLLETSRQCKSETVVYAFDIKDRSAIVDSVRKVHEHFGQLDYLVNDAGINPTAIPLEKIPDEYYDKLLNTNLRSMFKMTQTCLQYMKEGSAIVNLASMCSFVAFKYCSVYCITKAAIVGLTKSFALELGEKGIRINAVAPGEIETPTNTFVMAGQKAIDAEAQRAVALKRFGKPEEIASVISFLLSPDASYVNGAIYRIDGGLVE